MTTPRSSTWPAPPGRWRARTCTLWADFRGLQPGGAVIDVGAPLLSGAYLARERETRRVYLVGRTKRWIPNERIFNQYAFDWSKILDVNRANLPEAGPDIPGR